MAKAKKKMSVSGVNEPGTSDTGLRSRFYHPLRESSSDDAERDGEMFRDRGERGGEPLSLDKLFR